MTALPIPAAALALETSPRRLRRLIDQGAPVVRTGRRGRGKAALIDPDVIRAWIDSRTRAPADDARLKVFVAQLPEIVAEAVWRVFVDTVGPHKRAVAQACVAAWYQACVAAFDAAGAPELEVIPEKIDRLRAILG